MPYLKYPILIVLFAFFGCFLIHNTLSASDVFNDNFESYITGDLNNQGNWTHIFQGYYHSVSTDRAFTGLKSVKVDVPDGQYSGYQYYFGGTATSGTELVNVYLPSSEGHDVNFYYALYSSEANDFFNGFGFTYTFSTDEWKAGYFGTNYIWTLFGDVLTPDTWHSLRIDWDFIAPNRGFVLFIDGVSNAETHSFYSGLNAYNYADGWRSYGYGGGLHYEDDYGALGCGNWHSLEDCNNAGCFWTYESNLYCDESGCYLKAGAGTYLCESENINVCGQGELESACAGCLDETTCTAVPNDKCVWQDNNCIPKFASTNCDVGILCDNCKTQNTCEAKDCFWSVSDGQCYITGDIASNTQAKGVLKALNRVFQVWNKAPLNYVTSFISSVSQINPASAPVGDITFNLGLLGSSKFSFGTIVNMEFELAGTSYTVGSFCIALSKIALSISFLFFLWSWICWIFNIGSPASGGVPPEYGG